MDIPPGMKPQQRFGLLKTSSLQEDIEKIKVTQELLRSCKRARERYGVFFEQHNKVEEQMKLARVKEEFTQQTEDAVSEFKNKIRFIKKCIEVAEMSVEEGNNELGEAMKAKKSV